jgi:hypothetical protein
MDADLKTRFDQHPYGALAAALGAGYILGGGFFTPLTERLAKLVVKAGIRAALVPVVAAQLNELLTPLFTPAEAKEPAPPPPVPRAEPPRPEAA